MNMSESMQSPTVDIDFLIIGAMKCGTTSLFASLQKHPEINACTSKEPNFFTRNWDKGWDWYRGLYRDVPGLKGEASTSYTKFPGFTDAAERIARYCPDARLIYMVRHPIRRVVSHLHHNIISGLINEEEYLNQEFWNTRGRHMIACSSYFMQLQKYLEHFDRQQIYICSLEELTGNSEKYLTEIADFLGIDPAPLLERDLEKRNVSREKVPVKKGTVMKFMRVLGKYRLLPSFARYTYRQVERPELSKAQIDLIWSEVEPDLRKFEELIGRDLNYQR